MKMKPSANGKITLAFIALGKSCPSREMYGSKMCKQTLQTLVRLLLVRVHTVHTQKTPQ